MPLTNEEKVEKENLDKQEAEIDSQIAKLKSAKNDIRSKRNKLGQASIHYVSPRKRIDQRKFKQ